MTAENPDGFPYFWLGAEAESVPTPWRTAWLGTPVEIVPCMWPNGYGLVPVEFGPATDEAGQVVEWEPADGDCREPDWQRGN